MPSSFPEVIRRTGEKPTDGNQNQTRHYSEEFSRLLAIWLGSEVQNQIKGLEILPPEGKVPTCFGSKSLDVGCLDANRYLALDISVKTFNFKDRKTNAYSKNFTGRFYELLGEGLDLRLSYPNAVLVALIFLPEDSCLDGSSRRASSFGNAVKQFQKIAIDAPGNSHDLCFDFVFVGLHDVSSKVRFFDAAHPPPKHGYPNKGLTETQSVIGRLLKKVDENAASRNTSKANIDPAFRWED
ncbi:hypothetical protein N8510_02265 [bacterium]|nr:hypothetical protein [bacterium]